MTRVSLKEVYDNKDVVAQIYAIRDIAEGAEDTANNAVSTANTASEHVDALVPQVEGAVRNANNASASAQASAQTVAGYENRLSDVELKITTAEGDIVTIQGRITALETADGQNVKLSGDQTITGIKMVPTEATGTRSQQIANSAKIGAELDNYAHMLRTTGDQNFSGVKGTTSNFIGTYYGSVGIDKSNGIVIAERDTGVDIVTNPTISRFFPPLLFEDGAGHRVGGLRIAHNTDGTCALYVNLRNANGTNKNIMLAISDP